MANQNAPSGNPFQAYPWFPVPDALTRGGMAILVHCFLLGLFAATA
jgi:hypothetical protein